MSDHSLLLRGLRSAFRQRRAPRVSREHCYFFVRQLYVLHNAGVPLLFGLKAIETQLSPGPLKRVLRALAEDLLNGKTLSQALRRYPESFDPFFVGIIRIGESSGLLEQTLKRLADFLAWELDLKGKIQQSLQYPMITLSILLLAVILMVSFVLPRYAQLFGSLHIPLPLQTRFLMFLSRFLVQFGWLLLLGAALGAMAFWRAIHTPGGRSWWHGLLLRSPLLGPVLLQLTMSRFARTVAALSASGLPLLETLELAGEIVDNMRIKEALVRVCERVKGGEAFARALQAEPLFPATVIQMVSTGEEAGHLDELLQSVSDYYDQEATLQVKQLLTYIEPVLLVCVGAGVLLMATAVFVPMWDLVKVFKHPGR